MPRAPTAEPIATIIINDGVSAEMKRMKERLGKGLAGLGDMSASLAGMISENLLSSLRLIGLSAAIGGGSILGSLVLMNTALIRFASKSLQLRDTVSSLNMTMGEFKELVNIGMAAGLTQQQAETDVIQFAQKMLDLRRDAQSATRATAEELGEAGSGTFIARYLQRRLMQDGQRPYNNMKMVLQQMAKQATGTDADKLATETWGKIFGLGPTWNSAA